MIGLPIEHEVDEEIIIKRFKKLIHAKNQKDKGSNLLFKDLLESYKRSSFGTRKVAAENLYQLIFMPYQKDYTVLYDVVAENASDIELGRFSF